jgi:hypothetical protein
MEPAKGNKDYGGKKEIRMPSMEKGGESTWKSKRKRNLDFTE